MNLASMSPLLRFTGEHVEWLCAECRTDRAGAACDSVPRRMLRLYPLVSTEQIQRTPMKSGHIIAFVYPSPVSFCWPSGKTDTAVPLHSAQPEYYKDGQKHVYAYGRAASDVIWQTASAFNELVELH